MSYYAIVALVNALIATTSSVIVFFNNPGSRKNRFYALFSICIALWSYFYFAWQISETTESALFFIRATMFFAIWVPFLHYLQILSLFELETPFQKKFVYFLFAATLFLAATDFTPYLVAGVEQRLNFPYWPIPGPFFHVHVIMFVIPISFSVGLIWLLRKREASPVMRNKLAWMLIGVAFGYGGGGSNWPLWYNIPIPPVMNITVSIYPALQGFLFFRLGLFDIRLFVRDAFTYLTTAMIIGGLFSALAYPFVKDNTIIISFMTSALVLPLIYRPLHTWMRDKVQRRFWRAGQYLKTVDVTMEKIRETTYTYDDLAQNIVKSMRNTFPIEMAAVYFYDLGRKEFHLRAQEGMKNPTAMDLRYNRSNLAISETNPLMQLIGNSKRVVVTDVLPTGPDATNLERASRETLRKMEAEVLAPFLFAGKPKGMLVLGRKKNNQMFNQEDLDAIYAFGRMGEEVMRYIMGMETELKNTALYSHDMDNDTKSLVQTLQFIQSPMSKNLPEAKLHGLLQQAEDVAARLNQTFKLNRDRSSLIMRSIRGDYEKMPVDITKIVKASCAKFGLLAEKQQIVLDSSVLDRQAVVMGNADDLIRVIDNLLANGLRYVPQGGRIEVVGTELPDSFKITVKDNGQGINPDDIERIWEMGWQVKNAKQGASGFGLSIARQIVNLHNGTITVESEGKGKGTMFTIILPLVKES